MNNLIYIYENYGITNCPIICEKLIQQSSKECRDRWLYHYYPRQKDLEQEKKIQ